MHPCSGKSKGKKVRCKKMVPVIGGFCDYHKNQRIEGSTCKCWLDSGSQCQFPVLANGLCQYHTDVNICQSRLSNGDQCLRTIASGRQCLRCKIEGGPVLDTVKESAESLRHLLMKQNGSIIVPHSKPIVIKSMTTDVSKLIIPSALKNNVVDKPDACPICQDPMEGKYGLDHRKLKCGHYFHMDCLSKVYAMTCPMCRAAITESFLPKWVVERIKHNIDNQETENAIAREQATVRLVHEMQRQINNQMLQEEFGIPDELMEYIEEELEYESSINNSPV